MVTPEENRKRIARANAEEKETLEISERKYQLWKRDLDWTYGRPMPRKERKWTERKFQQRLAEEVKARMTPEQPEGPRQYSAPNARDISNPRPHRRSSSGKARKVRRGT